MPILREAPPEDVPDMFLAKIAKHDVDSLLTQDLLCSWSVAFGPLLLLTAGSLLTS